MFDNLDLIVASVLGDGEAETRPLWTAWHTNKFLKAATDGAVLPVVPTGETVGRVRPTVR